MGYPVEFSFVLINLESNKYIRL